MTTNTNSPAEAADPATLAETEAEAVMWWRKAAEESGLAQAQFNLANCFKDGLGGLPRDMHQAMAWWRKAADQGNAEAQCNLGNCYKIGIIDVVGDRDLGAARHVNPQEAAVAWYRKAASKNLPRAQYSLGVCFERGIGVPKNMDDAVEWYQKAADQGHARARARLATFIGE